jgi:hypothetical protein
MTEDTNPTPSYVIDWNYFSNSFPPTEAVLPADPAETGRILGALMNAGYQDIHRCAVVLFYAGFAVASGGGAPRLDDGSLDTNALSGEVNALFGLFLSHIHQRTQAADSEGGDHA